MLDDPALMRAILPALEADSALYRAYVYREEPPLDIAEFARTAGNPTRMCVGNISARGGNRRRDRLYCAYFLAGTST